MFLSCVSHCVKMIFFLIFTKLSWNNIKNKDKCTRILFFIPIPIIIPITLFGNTVLEPIIKISNLALKSKSDETPYCCLMIYFYIHSEIHAPRIFLFVFSKIILQLCGNIIHIVQNLSCLRVFFS